MLPVAALIVSAWRRRRELSDPEKLLWLWVLTLFVVFCLPSQRSSRYLLPAMPALAVLLALHWPRLRRAVVTSTLVLAGLVLSAISVVSFMLMGALPGPELYGSGHWALLLLAALVLVLGLVRPALDPAAVLATVFLVLLSFSSLLGPLDGPLGRYDETVQRFVEGRNVWVPVDFIAKEEGYRLLLPGARVHGYRDERDSSVADVLERHPLAVVRLRAGDSLGEGCPRHHHRRALRPARPAQRRRDPGDAVRPGLRTPVRP